MRRSTHAIVAVALLAAGLLVLPSGLRAADEPSYADKPASWWVEEALTGEHPDAALRILRGMGDGVVPCVAERLGRTRAASDRRLLLGLLAGRRSGLSPALPHLGPSLASGNAREVESALDVVLRAGPDAAHLAGEVARLLGSSSPRVRATAAQTLGRLGAAAGEHVPALIARLSDDDARTRQAAAGTLGGLGPLATDAVPRLLELSRSGPSDGVLLNALATLAPDDPAVTAELVRAAAGDDRAMRALRTLLGQSTLTGRAVLDAATRLATHADTQIRAAVAGALGRIGAERGDVPEPLLVLTSDTELTVAGAACSALEALGAPAHAHVDRIAAAWRTSPHPQVFTRLLYALRPTVGPQLLAAATDDSEALRGVAWHVLSRTGKAGLAVDAAQLSKLLFDERVALKQRVSLLHVLDDQRQVDPDVLREVCAGLAQEAESELAVRAIWALRGDAPHRPALIAASQRSEVGVREAAVRALQPLAAQFPDVRDALVPRLADEPSVATLAFEAFRQLGRDGLAEPGAWRDALVERLGEFLLSEDQTASYYALQIVEALPADVVPRKVVVAALANDVIAESLVSRLGHMSCDLRSELADAMRGDDLLLAARAARVWLMRRLDAAEAFPAIRPGLDPELDPRLVRAAVLAAVSLDDPRLNEIGGALVRIVRADVPGASFPACHGLARVAATSSVAKETLLAVARDPEHSAHAGVTGFLTQLGEEGRIALRGMLESPVRDARRNTLMVLTSLAVHESQHIRPAQDRLQVIADGDDLELAQIARSLLSRLKP